VIGAVVGVFPRQFIFLGEIASSTKTYTFFQNRYNVFRKDRKHADESRDFLKAIGSVNNHTMQKSENASCKYKQTKNDKPISRQDTLFKYGRLFFSTVMNGSDERKTRSCEWHARRNSKGFHSPNPQTQGDNFRTCPTHPPQ